MLKSYQHSAYLEERGILKDERILIIVPIFGNFVKKLMNYE